MKSAEVQKLFDYNPVAPLTGAWIEMADALTVNSLRLVAPLTGAWIEIWESLPMLGPRMVAPLTGAWIEIGFGYDRSQTGESRSPHGSVD